MDWDANDTLEAICDACSSYSEAKEMAFEELDHLDDDELGNVLIFLSKRYGKASKKQAPPATTVSAPPPKKDPPKASIRLDRELSEEDWTMIKAIDPALVMQMLRLRFRFTNMSAPSTWLKDNCSGLYYLPGGNRVLFELEDDAVLFKMNFEGKS